MITLEDLVPGAKFVASNQGTCIAPQSRKIFVQWVGPKDVHYIVDGGSRVESTPIERFLEIVNE